MKFLEKETLYIYSDEYKLGKYGDSLILSKDKEKVALIQTFKIKDIIFFGPTTLTSPVLNLCQSFGINAHFLGFNTKYYGSLMFDPCKNLYVRLAQYKAHTDQAKALSIAKHFLIKKFHSYEQCLQTFRKGLTLDIEQESIESSCNNEQLLGIEGAYTKKYYSILSQAIKNDTFAFTDRSHNPPEDQINSLLSLGYTLLSSSIHTFCNVVGLDPYIGFLHKNYYGRPSLVCDFTEIWRGFIDKWIINLVNRKEFAKEDFDENIRLKKGSLGEFLAKWKNFSQVKLFKFSEVDKEVTLLKIIEYNLRAFVKYILGEGELKSSIQEE